MNSIIESLRANAGHAHEGLEVFHLESIDSTNTWLLDWVQATQHSGAAMVIADRQTAGRGQHGRSWFSEAHGSLVCTYLPPRAYRVFDAPLYAMATAVAARAVLATYLSSPPQLKWPNDLLVSSRKLGGILIESRTIGCQRTGPVIGLGINVGLPSDDLPLELRKQATSLLIEKAEIPERGVLAGKIAAALEQQLALVMSGDLQRLIADYEEGLGLIGCQVIVETAKGPRVGPLLGLDPEIGARIGVEHGDCIIPLAQITGLRAVANQQP